MLKPDFNTLNKKWLSFQAAIFYLHELLFYLLYLKYVFLFILPVEVLVPDLKTTLVPDVRKRVSFKENRDRHAGPHKIARVHIFLPCPVKVPHIWKLDLTFGYHIAGDDGKHR